jgi:hypothetical protein
VIDNSAGPPTEAPGTQAGTLRLEVDVRDGDRAEVSIVAAPSLDDVAEALASLDQSRHTELTVIDSSGSYIAVGGGRGHYHVYLGAYDHDDRIILQNPDAADGDEIDLVVYGRPGRYAARDVVDLDAAADAVREFLRSGRPHPDLAWRP